ncbi:putative harbinger transposase-derived nuclease domain-containing protein [Senna tora]|uniref:Putative harbinger transposase-derived nuclease domain-containing protein n=1 Tax=Senna tora TaxID=362788 RepID=A0A834SPC7_9FABA|nr:putative harbinger transposase-derived nuclease domain-containing protein [Senna tora]
MKLCLKDVVAMGEHAWAPSSEVLPDNIQESQLFQLELPFEFETPGNMSLTSSSNNNDNVDDKVVISEDDDIFHLAVCAAGIAVEYYLKYCLKTLCRTSSHIELYKSNLVWHQLEACSKLAMTIIKPKDPSFSNVHPKLRNDDRYWPYFKDCIGAIDGTHVPCIVPSQEQIKYIGTAHDARIFNQAIRRHDLNFPHPPPPANNDDIVLHMEEGDGSSNTPLYMQSGLSTFMESTRNRIRDEIVENSPYV